MIRTPNRVTDRGAVLKAIEECDTRGREAFRDRHGFGKSLEYFVRHNGKTYDSKPLVAVAFGNQYRTKPLTYDEFSGGAASVAPALTRLEFAIVDEDLPDEPPPFRSEWLSVGDIYTREQLRHRFSIVDATLNNGVFKARGSRSIWLFVTEKKTADRPQLFDRLEGDMLRWSGQPAGRTDRLLIDHLSNGDEVLLFYRERRDRYRGGGFLYEGPFLYRGHSGSRPASFIFERDTLSLRRKPYPGADENGAPFDPKNVVDGRAKVLAEVTRRQGQFRFRNDLIAAYGGKCAITGCSVLPLLEAAHIYPYRGHETNDVTNGLLLRADIHTLFDLGLIAVLPNHELDICASLNDTVYADLDRLTPPKSAKKHPSPDALSWHRINVANEEARNHLVKRFGAQRAASRIEADDRPIAGKSPKGAQGRGR
ncbi:MAG: HNH endonuclease [Sphingosinicella sp.]|uniref:HNH endonuclease n=1 Tax=Sphingosinicella sp. TaxID=1917971 RepID=UPI004037F9E9